MPFSPDPNQFYAHTADDGGPWELLFIEGCTGDPQQCHAQNLHPGESCGHSNRVAYLAQRFASVFGAGEWGRLTGLWHDLKWAHWEKIKSRADLVEASSTFILVHIAHSCFNPLLIGDLIPQANDCIQLLDSNQPQPDSTRACSAACGTLCTCHKQE